MKKLFVLCLAFLMTSCSTMQLEKYPDLRFDDRIWPEPKNGISIIAKPMLDDKENIKYFGVTLIDKNILAVHLSIKNESANTSFIVPVEKIKVTELLNAEASERPEKGKENASNVIGTTAAIGILATGMVFLPLVAIAVQQWSDASVIKENFESKKLRTKTVDPGKYETGFIYFNWEHLKNLDAANACVEFLDPTINESFLYCLKIDLREAKP